MGWRKQGNKNLKFFTTHIDDCLVEAATELERESRLFERDWRQTMG